MTSGASGATTAAALGASGIRSTFGFSAWPPGADVSTSTKTISVSCCQALAMPVIGTGPDARVRFKANGMARWECRIERGTLRRLGEAEFVTETSGAVADLLWRARKETLLLKDECFGLNIPEHTQERRRRAESARRADR